MSLPFPAGGIRSTLQQFSKSEAAGGLVLMVAAALAMITANSPLADGYFHLLHLHIGPLSLQHWINDALMAAFFLLVGLEIKREMLEGQLSTWDRRILPGAAAGGGMLFPALFYVAFNWNNSEALRGWAIPTATDIAFALGVMALLGRRVPASLKVFLAALAIIDDLGAVVVIALFYTAQLNMAALGGAACILLLLFGLNRAGVKVLWPYLVLGVALWAFVFVSGIHATLAGVMLALTIPLKSQSPTTASGCADSPLLRLEHGLQRPVAFIIIPVFGFANAGVALGGVSADILAEPLTLGVAAGLLLGKLVGVFGTVALLVKLGLARLPAEAGWGQMMGMALLCGIGFTMSLFIGLLAFADPAIQDHVKIGILAGSLVSGLLGASVLHVFRRRAASR